MVNITPIGKGNCCVRQSNEAFTAYSQCSSCGFRTCALHAAIWTDDKLHCARCFASLGVTGHSKQILSINLRRTHSRRCLVVIDGLYIAGAQKSALSLIYTLHQLGMGVHLLALSGGGQWYDLFANICEVISISFDYSLSWDDLVSERGFEIPITVGAHLCAPSAWAAVQVPTDISLIAHLHSEISEHEHLTQDESRLLISRVDKVVVPSLATKRFFSSWFRDSARLVNDGKIAVVPNVVHPSLCLGNKRISKEAPNKIILFSPTRLDKDKIDLSLLLRFLEVLPSYKHVILVIAGDGEYRGDVEAFVIANRLGSFVHLLGFQPNLDSNYAEADAIVLFSKREAMPMVFLEAICFDIPFIAPRVGMFESLDSINGLFVYEPGDLTNLLEAINYILNNMLNRAPVYSPASRQKYLDVRTYESTIKDIYISRGVSH